MSVIHKSPEAIEIGRFDLSCVEEALELSRGATGISVATMNLVLDHLNFTVPGFERVRPSVYTESGNELTRDGSNYVASTTPHTDADGFTILSSSIYPAVTAVGDVVIPDDDEDYYLNGYGPDDDQNIGFEYFQSRKGQKTIADSLRSDAEGSLRIVPLEAGVLYLLSGATIHFTFAGHDFPETDDPVRILVQKFDAPVPRGLMLATL